MFQHYWQWFCAAQVYFLAKKTQAAGCLFFVIMGKLERTQMPRQQNNSWQCSVKGVKPRPSRAPENGRSRREIFAKSNPSASPRRHWMKAGSALIKTFCGLRFATLKASGCLCLLDGWE